MQYLLKQARAREVRYPTAVFQNQNYNTSLQQESLPLQSLAAGLILNFQVLEILIMNSEQTGFLK